jgi:DNA repair exonuclease SbcCD ATPase subunit
MIVALCVRIAMLTCFAGLPIAFFDEPTENIDAEKKQNLAQNLRSNLGGFSQIFIISHDDAFDRLTENVIYLEETREGTVPAAL